MFPCPRSDTHAATGNSAARRPPASESSPSADSNGNNPPPDRGQALQPQDNDAALLEREEAQQHEPHDRREDEDEGGTRQTVLQTNMIRKAVAAATEAQPTGNTLSTTNVKTSIPSLLQHTLLEYQHVGLDWLVTMHEKGLDSILADEMARLSSPNLSRSVVLNWEREFREWCPSFKILAYYGNEKERRLKRAGWSKPNAFHVCITSYILALQDQHWFRRKEWEYLILDEAHSMKNVKSQRWQTLLNFSAKRRLLLTGTPLPNDLTELWALMHFLMLRLFRSHSQFEEWSSDPMNDLIDGDSGRQVSRLQAVLRPFLLRRLKKDVEQLPRTVEHIVPCPLSKRQRHLYEELVSRADMRDQLASVNVLVQLRKVCNHPDLLTEERPVASSFGLGQGLSMHAPSVVVNMLAYDYTSDVDLGFLNLRFIDYESMNSWQSNRVGEPHVTWAEHVAALLLATPAGQAERPSDHWVEDLAHLVYSNERRCAQRPLYGLDLRHRVRLPASPADEGGLVLCGKQRALAVRDAVTRFTCVIVPARAPPPVLYCSHPRPSDVEAMARTSYQLTRELSPRMELLWPALVGQQIQFPDRRLLQHDCGKLQELDRLLRRVKQEGRKMLDVLEDFLNIHGHSYLRMDGTTPLEERRRLMERFNADPRIFLFILSTRSCGPGVRLVAADTAIFYDSDWDSAMDRQAQALCHRIGQTREVHVYRLVTRHTIEEIVLRKANQKRNLEQRDSTEGQSSTPPDPPLPSTPAQRDEEASVSWIDNEWAIASVNREAAHHYDRRDRG